MRRAAVIQYNTGPRVVSRAEVYRELRKTWHLHYCRDRDCRSIYECPKGGCVDVAVNERCRPCRGLRRSVYLPVRDPQPCCRGNCMQVTENPELIRYHLAGPGPWFQCTTCARCHGWPCHIPKGSS